VRDRLPDQSPARTNRRRAGHLHRHLEAVDEAPPDRDESVGVAEHPDPAPVRERPPHAWMVVEIPPLRQYSSAGAPSDQDGVMGADPPAVADEPTQDVGMRGAPEPVHLSCEHLVRRPVGQHDRPTRELDDRMDGRMMVTGERCEHLDPTVDRRESARCGVEQHPVKWVHGDRGYGRGMRVDVMTLPRALAQMGPLATSTERAGFDGMLFTEGGRTAYPAVTAAALAAPGLDMSTGVAVAFPRSPMITAQVAWELQELTEGRFRIGLGTQVRTHVVRRYGMSFERPGPRLRDYVLAVKACFAAFRGADLDHHGEFYELDFLTRQWSPGPIGPADPKVDIAAVNPWMLTMAGEVADGVHVHPIGEPGYLARHVVPGIAAGAALAGRDPGEIAVIVPATTIVGDTDAEIVQAREAARASLSFYGSTPNYAFIWDEAGFEGTTERIRSKQKAGDLAGMAAEITDDHLAVFCTEARWDDLADALIDKYDGIVDRLVFYNPAFDTPERFERYGAVARSISARTSN